MDNSGVSDSKWLMIQSTVASFTSNEDNEISETSGLSPLTSTLDQSLNLQDDGLFTSDKMGIENTWSEMNHVSSDCPIPLPPITRSDDFSNSDTNTDPIGESSLGIEHGPFLPPNNPTLNNLFSENIDNQDDTALEVTTPTGVCGLRNLGNTCFMAAGLQCLTATPPVLQHFLELPCDEKMLPTESLMSRFSSLLSKMWSGRYSVVKPTEFKQTLGAYHTQFKDYRQHDCQEFLALLLDSLHEQMNVARACKSSHVPASTTTANMINSHQNGANIPDKKKFIIDMYDNQPSSLSPSSPRIFIGGSPRSNYGDLDSTANSLQGSPLNDDEEDEETLDSDEIIGAKSSFISTKQENGTTDSLRLDKLLELSSSKSVLGFFEKEDGKKDSGGDCDAVYSRSPLDNESESVNDNHNFDNKSINTKRLKEVNAKNICGADCMSSGSDAECDGTLDKCSVKRMRLDSHEKNFRRENQTESQCLRMSVPIENGALASHEETEADKHWVKHLRSNRSVIVDTFQGQFKSTVVCEVCKHVSVTYEPFMYLSVPLPHAMERQLTVTYIPANDEPPIRCVVSLNKQSKVGKLKEELLKIIGKEHLAVSNIALAEVLENHISKILDNSTLVRQINVSNRSIYAFELVDHPDPNTIANELNDNAERLPAADSSQSVSSTIDESHQCTICYDEIDTNVDEANKNKTRVIYLRKHSENNCNIRMCNTCIEKYFKKEQTELPCPVCHTSVTESSFTDVDPTGRPRPAVRILSLPVVLRYDQTDSETSHSSNKLFGHPHLVKLPSQISAKSLCEILNRFVPQNSKYTVHLVDGQGQRCSRCIYTQHCTGCPIPESGLVVLQNNDTLAVVYSNYIPQVAEPIDHISVSKQRSQHPLSLYDCLQAFSQSETLDEHNPWFCPKCKKNQCATKTLTVHRYPKFLIVYLKRFVFYECVSMKLDDRVTFPLVDLNVGRHQYDLYACVCHFGGVSAGHYTAYTRNPQTSVWHYYNDEATSKQKPQEEDFSHAYILFYTRQESNLKSCNI